MSDQTADSGAATPASGLGRMFRAAREKSGQSLADVSEALRITQSSLAAIEEERFDALPALTYAIGFVRAYASYLDLDADEAVRRMHFDSADQDKARTLSFPMPADVGRGPSRGMLLAALLAGLLVYGVWYLSVRSGRPPDAMAEAPPMADEAVPPQPAVAQPPAVASENTDALAPVEINPAVDAAVTHDAPAASAAENTPVEPLAEPLAPDLPDVAALAPGAVGGIETPPVALVAPAPAVRLRAIAEAWIEVTRAGGDVIVNRVLAAGEEYVPPDETGLRLTTGDAGALEVYVNGVAIAPLGARGAIVRDVSLDRASLSGAPPLN